MVEVTQVSQNVHLGVLHPDHKNDFLSLQLRHLNTRFEKEVATLDEISVY